MKTDHDRRQVNFGHERVAPRDKTERVNDVFASVAERYDVMNDLMSFGSHRLMKRMAVQMSGARMGDRILDLAGGTGDLGKLFSPIVGASGQVVLADYNRAMMTVGRDRLLNHGCANVAYCQLLAERLPFGDAAFDRATIAFGLRNFTDKQRALQELRRVIRPGGSLLILEFSKPQNRLLGNAYKGFQALWPGIGKLVANDASSYRYLVESIDVHPDQKTLKLMMADEGFTDCSYHNLLGGVAAIHRGTVPPAVAHVS